MGFARKYLAVLGAVSAIGLNAPVYAQDDTVTIGVLTDMSGIYSTLTGEASVLAAQMAIDSFGGTVDGKPIKLLVGDHLHKPEVGSNIVRQWIDEEDLDLVVDLPNSSVMLAVNEIIKDHGHAVLISSAGQSSKLVNEACSPYGFQWTINSYAMAHSLASLSQEDGSKKWFLIQPDYAYGEAVAKDLTAAITEAGGEVVGLVKHPLKTTDFASYILQAQSSGADVLGLLSAGGDLVSLIKQTSEFGVTQKMVTTTMDPSTAKAIGLNLIKGINTTEGYYWTQNEKWSEEFMKRHSKGQVPNAISIGVYSGVRHFLEAYKAAEKKDRDSIVAAMRAMPVNDEFVKDGKVRQDGLMIHPTVLLKAKAPAESKGEWDLYDIVAMVPGDKAFAPLSESKCPLVKN